jgi:hypothetical protein
MVSFSTKNGVIFSNHLNMFMQPGFNIKRIAIQTVEFVRTVSFNLMPNAGFPMSHTQYILASGYWSLVAGCPTFKPPSLRILASQLQADDL